MAFLPCPTCTRRIPAASTVCSSCGHRLPPDWALRVRLAKGFGLLILLAFVTSGAVVLYRLF